MFVELFAYTLPTFFHLCCSCQFQLIFAEFVIVLEYMHNQLNFDGMVCSVILLEELLNCKVSEFCEGFRKE
jgi:hypothetical protein